MALYGEVGHFSGEVQFPKQCQNAPPGTVIFYTPRNNLFYRSTGGELEGKDEKHRGRFRSDFFFLRCSMVFHINILLLMGDNGQ